MYVTSIRGNKTMEFHSFIIITKNKPRFSKKTAALSSILNNKEDVMNNKYRFAEPKTNLSLSLIVNEDYSLNNIYSDVFEKITSISDNQIYTYVTSLNINPHGKKSLSEMLCTRRDYLKDLYNASITDVTIFSNN